MSRTGRRLRTADRQRLEDEIARAQRLFERWQTLVVELDEARGRAGTEREEVWLAERKRQAEHDRDDAARSWRYLTTLLEDALRGG